MLILSVTFEKLPFTIELSLSTRARKKGRNSQWENCVAFSPRVPTNLTRRAPLLFSEALVFLSRMFSAKFYIFVKLYLCFRNKARCTKKLKQLNASQLAVLFSRWNHKWKDGSKKVESKLNPNCARRINRFFLYAMFVCVLVCAYNYMNINPFLMQFFCLFYL